MHSRRNPESSTNTATRAATEKSTFGSGSPKTDDFRTPERYRRRSIANETASAIKHRQQGKRILFGQSAAEYDTKQRCVHNARREISILAWKSFTWLSRRGSYTGKKVAITIPLPCVLIYYHSSLVQSCLYIKFCEVFQHVFCFVKKIYICIFIDK